jgi:hypothetical protein
MSASTFRVFPIQPPIKEIAPFDFKAFALTVDEQRALTRALFRSVKVLDEGSEPDLAHEHGANQRASSAPSETNDQEESSQKNPRKAESP